METDSVYPQQTDVSIKFCINYWCGDHNNNPFLDESVRVFQVEYYTNTTWLEGKQGNLFSRDTGYGPIISKPKVEGW